MVLAEILFEKGLINEPTLKAVVSCLDDKNRTFNKNNGLV